MFFSSPLSRAFFRALRTIYNYHLRRAISITGVGPEGPNPQCHRPPSKFHSRTRANLPPSIRHGPAEMDGFRNPITFRPPVATLPKSFNNIIGHGRTDRQTDRRPAYLNLRRRTIIQLSLPFTPKFAAGFPARWRRRNGTAGCFVIITVQYKRGGTHNITSPRVHDPARRTPAVQTISPRSAQVLLEILRGLTELIDVRKAQQAIDRSIDQVRSSKNDRLVHLKVQKGCSLKLKGG